MDLQRTLTNTLLALVVTVVAVNLLGFAKLVPAFLEAPAIFFTLAALVLCPILAVTLLVFRRRGAGTGAPTWIPWGALAAIAGLLLAWYLAIMAMSGKSPF